MRYGEIAVAVVDLVHRLGDHLLAVFVGKEGVLAGMVAQAAQAGMPVRYFGNMNTGLYFGLRHGVVVNVTKDAIWARQAALPESTGANAPNFANVMGWDEMPDKLTIPQPRIPREEQQEQLLHHVGIRERNTQLIESAGQQIEPAGGWRPAAAGGVVYGLTGADSLAKIPRAVYAPAPWMTMRCSDKGSSRIRSALNTPATATAPVP